MRTNKIVRRHVARAILLDPSGRVLLFFLDPGRDPAGRGYWYLPGGGIKSGETPEDAVRRELREEVGLDDLDVSAPVVHLTGVRFEFDGRQFEQDEWHLVARAPIATIGQGRAGDNETASAAAHRWWSIDDVRSTAATIYPRQLETLMRKLLENGQPAEPWHFEDDIDGPAAPID
jgi:ADP-ribose pyrophosphatase YjhB (NUDIX family)